MYTVHQTEDFVAWLDGIKYKRAQVRIAARLRQVEAGALGDWQPIKGDVSELKVDSAQATACISFGVVESSSCCSALATSRPRSETSVVP